MIYQKLALKIDMISLRVDQTNSQKKKFHTRTEHRLTYKDCKVMPAQSYSKMKKIKHIVRNGREQLE